MTRTEELLRAAHALMKQIEVSPQHQDALALLVWYDSASCDGLCLIDDIESHLDMEEEEANGDGNK